MNRTNIFWPSVELHPTGLPASVPAQTLDRKKEPRDTDGLIDGRSYMSEAKGSWSDTSPVT